MICAMFDSNFVIFLSETQKRMNEILPYLSPYRPETFFSVIRDGTPSLAFSTIEKSEMTCVVRSLPAFYKLTP